MHRFLILAAALACLPSLAHAKGRSSSEIGTSNKFGLGLVLGSPSGGTGKLYVGRNGGALQATLATWVEPWGWYDPGGFYTDIAYLWHPAQLAHGSSVVVPFHAGVGGFLSDGDHGWLWRDHDWHGDWVEVGPRGVVGLDFDLTRIPLQFFVDLGVNVTVYPGFWPDATLGTGARWFF